MNKINNYITKLKKDKFWNNLFKNSFWAFIGDASSSVIGLLVTIFLIRIIGSDSYGILVLAQSYMQILDVIINVQSWKSVIQYGQKAIVNKNKELLHSYVKLGTILDVTTAIICCIISILIASFVGRIFGWSKELVICAQIFSITIVSHFSGTPTAILRLLNKFNLVALQKFISAFLKIVTLFVIYKIYGNLSLINSVIIYMITDFIGNILLVIFAFVEYNKKYGVNGIIKAKLPNDFKQFITFTLWGTLSEIVDIPVNYIDVFIISLLGNKMVSVFKVFKQVVSILQKVTSPIQQSILPQFSELSARNEKKRGYEVVTKIQKVSFKIGIVFSILIGLSSPLWLKFIYGELYASYWYVLLLYLVIQTYALSYTTIHPFYLSLDKARNSTLYILIANIVYLIVAYLLVLKLGIIGMVIAFGVQVILAINLKRLDILHSLKKGEI